MNPVGQPPAWKRSGCHYCGLGVLPAHARYIIVDGRTARVHAWHKRRTEEVAAR